MLADLGCSVVRVEALKPGLGQMLPPHVKGESLYYWSLHRNKERIALDLKKPEAIEVINRLAKDADIVLENFRPGVMNRLGIGYEALSAINKRIIFCSISGYGQDTSFNKRPGHDLNFIAEAGVLGMNTQANGEPIIPGILVADYSSASHAAVSITSALYDRERTGTGRHLDIGMFQSTLYTSSVLATSMMYMNEMPENGLPEYRATLANYSVYKCKDERYIAVASLEPQFWLIFCQRIERPDLSNKLPVGSNKQMRAELAGVMAQKTLSEWMEIFEGSDCCVSPVNNLDESLSFAPTAERGMVINMEHPILGDVPQLRTPLPFHDPAAGKPQASKAPRESTVEILAGLGYEKAQIEKLAQEGVILPPQAASVASESKK